MKLPLTYERAAKIRSAVCSPVMQCLGNVRRESSATRTLGPPSPVDAALASSRGFHQDIISQPLDDREAVAAGKKRRRNSPPSGEHESSQRFELRQMNAIGDSHAETRASAAAVEALNPHKQLEPINDHYRLPLEADHVLIEPESLLQRVSRAEAELLEATKREASLIQDLSREQAKRQLAEAEVRRSIAEKKAEAARQLVLDDFTNSLDQVSFGDVVRQLQALNDSLDNFTLKLLEQVPNLTPNYDFERYKQKYSTEWPFLRAIRKFSPDKDGQDMLAEVLVHQVINSYICECFFQHPMGIQSSKEGLIDRVYQVLYGSETFQTIQRWRALTSRALFEATDLVDQLQNHSLVLSKKLILIISLVYGQDQENLETLQASMRADVLDLVSAASELSRSICHEVVSARLSVLSFEDHRPINQAWAVQVWEDMPLQHQDVVVGTYHLGIVRLDAEGKYLCLQKAKVSTTAIVREVEKARDS